MQYCYKDNVYFDKEKNIIILKNQENFKSKHIFECGQAFRWEKTEIGSYIIVAFDRVIEVYEKDNDIYIENTTEEDFYNIWIKYFDLERDYNQVKKDLQNTKAYKLNNSLKEAIEFGDGIRILNQDSFEMIISFIISANNQIPRIKSSIKILSEVYGDFIQNYKGVDYYSFPKPSQLAFAKVEEVREKARVGFRDKRIVNAAKTYLNNLDKFDISLDSLTLEKNLLDLEGVGPKVKDCILLFGYSRKETFPIDVWVKRLMEYLYIKESIPNKKIMEYAINLFGEMRGLAQQYLFYYARENKLGK